MQLKSLLADEAFERRDPSLVLLHQVSGMGVIVERRLVKLADPNADQIAGQVMPLCQPMQGLAADELRGNLAFELDAMIVNSSSQSCPPRGAHSRTTCDRARLMCEFGCSEAGDILAARRTVADRTPLLWMVWRTC